MSSKLAIVEEEADECLYWMELLHKMGLVSTTAIRPVAEECRELLAMTVASIRTLRTTEKTSGVQEDIHKLDHSDLSWLYDKAHQE